LVVATFVLAHGAWSSAWAWKKMRPLMRAGGHDFFTPSYTGLGERGHLGNASVNLDTHIQDVVGTIEIEDLRDIMLLGHSYGGMVATGVADRVRSRVSQLIYLDAFVPKDGQSAFDLQPAERANGMREAARAKGDGWRIPPNPMPSDTPEADLAWAAHRRLPQPLQTFEQKLRLSGQAPPPRSYIYCKKCAPGDVFRQFAERAQRESGWRYFELDASHNPHITMPQELMALLENIIAAPQAARVA
jgi:pimeloyl-ACP methyl ester carboxylesterase